MRLAWFQWSHAVGPCVCHQYRLPREFSYSGGRLLTRISYNQEVVINRECWLLMLQDSHTAILEPIVCFSGRRLFYGRGMSRGSLETRDSCHWVSWGCISNYGSNCSGGLPGDVLCFEILLKQQNPPDHHQDHNINSQSDRETTVAADSLFFLSLFSVMIVIILFFPLFDSLSLMVAIVLLDWWAWADSIHRPLEWHDIR